MRISAGIISTQPYTAPIVYYKLSADRLSDTELLDGANASPGRYVGEILRRQRQLYPQARAHLAFNPYLQIPPEVVQRILFAAEQVDLDSAHSWLLTDSENQQPLAYLLTAAMVDACPPVHLALLSTADTALDSAFLAASFGDHQLCAVLPFAGKLPLTSGYFARPDQAAYLFALRHATALLAGAPSDAVRLQWLRETQRVAVMGWHAGDVLFLLQALQLEDTPFTAMLVPTSYADIVRYVTPQIECLTVDLPIPNRGAYQLQQDVVVQEEYTRHLLRTAHGHRFFHFLRPGLRDYNATHHHLREVSAFAIGGRGHRLRRLPPLPGDAATELGHYQPVPGRVLIQFDAGWELKGYPVEARRELLDILLEEGFAPLMLGAKEPSHPQVPAIGYRNLAEFRALLSTAEVLIGCDSFPVHFANQYGTPTITLFGSTRPANSRALESSTARYLHHPLPCVPCGAVNTCPQFGSQSCPAHAPAGEVAEAVRQLVARRPLRPRTLAEYQQLVTEVVPSFVFPGQTPADEGAQDRFLDRLFAKLRLEDVPACPLCHSTALRDVGERFRLPIAACPDCGLWLVRRRIVPADLGVLYSEQYWVEFMQLHSYPTHVERYLFDYMSALERVLDISRLAAPPAAVLDIGCALATLPRRLRELGYDSAGLELDAALAQKATLLAGAPVYSSLAALQQSGRRFDVITLFDVFEHLYEPLVYLNELKTILAPRGWLLIETFRTDSPKFVRDGLEHEDVKPIEHPFMYRQEHLVALLGQAGFTVDHMTYPRGTDDARVRVFARLGNG